MSDDEIDARKALEENVFLRYGAGIQSYFSIQANLIKLFCVLSLFTIPQLLIYNYFDGYNWTTQESLFEQLSFGNMGYSGNYCGMKFINWDSQETVVSLQCQGTARIRRVLDSGLVDIN